MDFALGSEVEAFRSQVRDIIHSTYTHEDHTRQHESGTFASLPLYQALAAHGFLERAVPGLGKGDPIELYVLFSELEKAGAPYEAVAVALVVAGIVNHVGTDEQRQRILPGLLSGRSLASLGYSEANSGSDVASASTRAVATPDGDWVINGSKMWTTMAHVADWILLLTRTDLDAPKHKGLTMFVLPLDTPGISIEPVWTMGDERTNATFYDDVRVGQECVLGEVNGGWQVMTVGLSLERGVAGETNSGPSLLRHFHEWAKQTGALGDSRLREKMARTAIDNEVTKLLTQRSAWIAGSGGTPTTEGAMTKLFANEAFQRAARWFQEAAGPEGILRFEAPDAAGSGWLEYEVRRATVLPIRGGTTEINRNVIARRHLGLPRTT
ncbi:hypothetical protein A5674_13765 [Mycobacterium malmoense]|uniref:acyl-CoA dehydrogenase family protein n=1 Tax=Mycobacterium malmoense TaxID=1780 RepID=UPI00080BC321|nr:acyl-CoA dehydrogenase family protein [Mycobacterium malmoense]OCB30172.1 hypothetical protein A5674_13765 [Mycobacterium malmoense]